VEQTSIAATVGGLEWDFIKLQFVEGNKLSECRVDPGRGGESLCSVEGVFGTGLVVLDRPAGRRDSCKEILSLASHRHANHNLREFTQKHNFRSPTK
jgi:hypothetical protein